LAGKRKSLAQQLFEAQQRKAREKAAQEKKDQDARLKAEAAAVKAEQAEKARQQRAAERLQVQKAAADAQAVRQVLRAMDKRDAQRVVQEAREAKEKERQDAADVRLALRQAKERRRQEAVDLTNDIKDVVAALGQTLAHRDRQLEGWRERTDAAYAEGGDAEAYADAVAQVLGGLMYLRQSKVPAQVAYAAESRQFTVVIDLPSRSRVPVNSGYRYNGQTDEITPIARKAAEIQFLYQRTIAQFALCVADYALSVTSPALVDAIAINGHLRSKDRATGRPVNPCLVTFLATREQFEQLVLDEAELDPALCLRHLHAVVSPHPYDLEGVLPIVDFELQRFKLMEDSGSLSGLDSRKDLLAISPYEFEHLIKDLFVAMGYKAWRTQDSRDDGIDAVAVREDSIVKDDCVIQAKRYKNMVPVEAVRALTGTMEAKKASTGVVVTTSWFGPASYDHARQAGRMTLIDGRNLKALLKKHLNMDILLSLPKTPPGWDPSDIAGNP
jgi:restriction system protein